MNFIGGNYTFIIHMFHPLEIKFALTPIKIYE